MMNEHNFRYIDINSELASNREDRRERLIDFTKGQLIDAYDNGSPQAHIDSQRWRLAHLLGIVGSEEPGSEALAA